MSSLECVPFGVGQAGALCCWSCRQLPVSRPTPPTSQHCCPKQQQRIGELLEDHLGDYVLMEAECSASPPTMLELQNKVRRDLSKTADSANTAESADSAETEICARLV